MEPITHEQIYERLLSVETKVDDIDTNTKGMVEAFNNVQGAFKVLGWIASAAKPIIAIVTMISVVTAYFQMVKK
jgi:hypothetical protein